MGHDPARSAEVERLARAIAGEGSHPELLYYARAAAEAELDIVRVRAARVSAIETPATEPWRERIRACRRGDREARSLRASSAVAANAGVAGAYERL